MATLESSLRLMTPILLAGLGGLLSLASGKLNIALEGQMLAGAFFAVVGSYVFGSSVAGVVAAAGVGGGLGLLFGLLVVRARADVFVVGITMNVLCAGLTAFLLGLLFQVKGSFSDPRIDRLPNVDWPLLDQIPIVGGLLMGLPMFTIVAIVLVPFAWVLVYRTRWGTYLRAAGEAPEALETAGIAVDRVRLVAQIACGILCGLAGAHLSLGSLALFADGMTAGRGFIALAAVIVGGANPIGLLGSAFLFSSAEAATLRLPSGSIPSQLPEMLPYIATLGALCVIGISRRTRHYAPSLAAMKRRAS